MASYTHEQLKDMTVAQLREIAQGMQHEALEGFSTMHKDHLLPALCKVLGIHTHHAAVGAEKTRVKIALRKLKVERDQAMTAGDRVKLAALRHQIHLLKHKLRQMAKVGG